MESLSPPPPLPFPLCLQAPLQEPPAHRAGEGARAVRRVKRSDGMTVNVRACGSNRVGRSGADSAGPSTAAGGRRPEAREDGTPSGPGPGPPGGAGRAPRAACRCADSALRRAMRRRPAGSGAVERKTGGGGGGDLLMTSVQPAPRSSAGGRGPPRLVRVRPMLRPPPSVRCLAASARIRVRRPRLECALQALN